MRFEILCFHKTYTGLELMLLKNKQISKFFILRYMIYSNKSNIYNLRVPPELHPSLNEEHPSMYDNNDLSMALLPTGCCFPNIQTHTFEKHLSFAP